MPNDDPRQPQKSALKSLIWRNLRLDPSGDVPNRHQDGYTEVNRRRHSRPSEQAGLGAPHHRQTQGGQRGLGSPFGPGKLEDEGSCSAKKRRCCIGVKPSWCACRNCRECRALQYDWVTVGGWLRRCRLVGLRETIFRPVTVLAAVEAHVVCLVGGGDVEGVVDDVEIESGPAGLADWVYCILIRTRAQGSCLSSGSVERASQPCMGRIVDCRRRAGLP